MAPPKLTMERLTALYQSLYAFNAGLTIIIAGGAVRDTLNNREVKDIDIYIQFSNPWEDGPEDASAMVDWVVDKINTLFYSKGKCLSSEELTISQRSAYKDAHIEIQSVWHWDHGFGDLPCDVIFLNEDPVGHVKHHFDFGICQAWVGFYGLKTTDAYWSDVLNKTLTYLDPSRTPAGKERSYEHLERLLQKYPGWRPRNIARKAQP